MDNRVESIRRLLSVWESSSSKEEFRLKITASGEKTGFLDMLLFRICLFRKTRPTGFGLAGIALLGFGIVGFSVLDGIFGPKNPLAGIGIILLSAAVMTPLTILLLRIEEFCDKVFRSEGEIR